MELIFLLPILQWLLYAGMIIGALLAYRTGRAGAASMAQAFAILTALLACAGLFSGSAFNGFFQLAAAWSCWLLSLRTRPRLRPPARPLTGPDDILDAGV